MWPELNVVMFECICRILFLFCHNHEKVVTGSNSSVPYVGLGLTATNEIMKQNTADYCVGLVWGAHSSRHE
jgi:hypothetical protein